MRNAKHTRSERAIAATLEAQYGVIHIRQIIGAGRDRHWAHRQVRGGRMRIELPSVFATAGAPRSWHQRAMAVALHAGPEAAASHAAAGRCWGFPRHLAADPEASTTRRLTGGPCPHALHRVDDELLREIVHVDGIPCTSVPRTLMDLAGIGHPIDGSLDHAFRNRLTTLSVCWLYAERREMVGRRGIARLRDALFSRSGGMPLTDSELEAMLVDVIRRAGLREPVHHPEIDLSFGAVHPDLAYPDLKIAIEADGSYHLDRLAFERDRERDAELQSLGWIVLRFTWAQVRFRPDWVAQQIAAALRSRAEC